jgi:3-hydroxybutyryl-CoA dehydrogenase
MHDEISRVAVFGTGQMGPGVALVAAIAGCDTIMVGRTQDSLARGEARFTAYAEFLVTHDVLSSSEAAAARQRLHLSTLNRDALNVDLAVESIIENLAVKQQLFRELDAMYPVTTIISSDTSALRIGDVAALVRNPERTITTHFWNPPHLMPLVDVMKGEKTSDETVQKVRSFLLRCGKSPVVGLKDVPGQIGNRLFQAIIREAMYMVQEGICSAEDVDAAVSNGCGLRFPVYGPLTHMDNVGLDLAFSVQATALPALYNGTTPVPMLSAMISDGKLGVKSGAGFFNWSERDIAAVLRRRDLFLVEQLKARRQAGKARP